MTCNQAGRRGGKNGVGKAKARTVSSQQARKAALARWHGARKAAIAVIPTKKQSVAQIKDVLKSAFDAIANFRDENGKRVFVKRKGEK